MFNVWLREIIDQYVMELPTFNDKKNNSAPNQQRKKKVLKPIRTHTLSATRRRQCKFILQLKSRFIFP